MFAHIFALVYVLAILVVSFIAWSAMISKSGYVKWWVFAPLLPVVTVVVTGFVKYHDTKSFLKGGRFTLSELGMWGWINAAAFAVAWILFLIFAFSPWPLLGGGGGVMVSAARRQPTGAAGVRPSSIVPANRPSAPRGPAAAGVSAAGGVDTRRRIYCPWCGEHIPGNRALGHDCGPKDRPEVICRYCGKPFPEGTDFCPTCDA
jgi:hypothetical protein